jgi:tRNA(fMet)-specific endonuclease VapC
MPQIDRHPNSTKRVAYLFDTDTISAVLRPRPDLAVARRLAAVPSNEQFTSAITLGELLFGALRRGRTDLLERIQAISEVVPALPFHEPAARNYAELRTELERRGTPLAEPDLRIAAIARTFNLVLVTGNERHFRRVPALVVENWLEPQS